MFFWEILHTWIFRFRPFPLVLFRATGKQKPGHVSATEPASWVLRLVDAWHAQVDQVPAVHLRLVFQPTHPKNMMVKLGSSSPNLGMKSKNVWNHHPVIFGGCTCFLIWWFDVVMVDWPWCCLVFGRGGRLRSRMTQPHWVNSGRTRVKLNCP